MCNNPKNCENCKWCILNKDAILPSYENYKPKVNPPKEPDDYFAKLLMAMIVLYGDEALWS